MKALILSGGYGTRLRPITLTRSKQLIPVANKPVLFYGLEAIIDAGIDEIGVVVGDNKEEIDEAIQKKDIKANITLIEQKQPLGLAHAVQTASSFISDDPFLLYLGDNILEEDLKPIVECFKKEQPAALILLSKVKKPEEYGIAFLDQDQRVIALKEKPSNPESNLALVGLYILSPKILQAAKEITPSWRGELEITDALQYLIDTKNQINAYIIDGWWRDTGQKEDLLAANRYLLSRIKPNIIQERIENSKIEGRVIIEEGAQIIDSLIRGPAIIGNNCSVEHSYIGPYTSLSNMVNINNCEINNSIVMENSHLSNITRPIEGSIIGKNVVIKTHLHKKPGGIRMMVGDHAHINLA